MLQDKWEDDATSTTAATTCCDLDVEEESKDEDAFDKENRYREPSSVLTYEGQGKTKQKDTCDRLRVVVKHQRRKRTTKGTLKTKTKIFKRCNNDATRKPPGT